MRAWESVLYWWKSISITCWGIWSCLFSMACIYWLCQCYKLIPHKEKFIKTCTNRVMHLGNRTSNKYVFFICRLCSYYLVMQLGNSSKIDSIGDMWRFNRFNLKVLIRRDPEYIKSILHLSWSNNFQRSFCP